jgi:hypothetical protein
MIKFMVDSAILEQVWKNRGKSIRGAAEYAYFSGGIPSMY